MKTVLLNLILVCGLQIGAFAQFGVAAESETADPAGEWYGYITQTPSGLASRYGFHLNLSIQGNKVSGYSRIHMEDDETYFGVMKLAGVWEDEKLVLTEVEIAKEQIYSYAYWCLKDLFLNIRIENGLVILEGNWESERCSFSTGNIHLERLLI